MKRLLLLSLLAVVGCGSSEKPVTLTFTPPDSLKFSGEVITTRTQSAGTQSMSDTNITFSTQVMTTRDGVTKMIVRADSVLKGAGGSRANDRINQLLVQTDFTQTFDKTGMVTEMTGYEELFQRMEDSLTPQQVQAMRMAVNPKLLAKREIAQWNSTVGRFAQLGGLVPAKLMFDTAIVELPSGAPLIYYRAIRLMGTEDNAGKNCARIEMYSHTDPRQLAPLLSLTEDDVMKNYPGYDSTANMFGDQKMSSQDKSTWLIETATLLVHEHISEQTINVTLPTAQGQMVNTQLVQTETKRFHY